MYYSVTEWLFQSQFCIPLEEKGCSMNTCTYKLVQCCVYKPCSMFGKNSEQLQFPHGSCPLTHTHLCPDGVVGIEAALRKVHTPSGRVKRFHSIASYLLMIPLTRLPDAQPFLRPVSTETVPNTLCVCGECGCVGRWGARVFVWLGKCDEWVWKMAAIARAHVCLWAEVVTERESSLLHRDGIYFFK